MWRRALIEDRKLGFFSEKWFHEKIGGWERFRAISTLREYYSHDFVAKTPSNQCQALVFSREL